MPNPGTFRGSRLAFLDSQAEIYADGVRNNQLASTVADIQRRYLKRYPMSLDHNVEPTQEWLDSVDDSAPDPEVQAPDLEAMDERSYSAASATFNKLVDDTKARKESIKRRLAYVYSKTCAKDTALDAKGNLKKGASDPLTALKAKLAGVELKVPRMRTAYNVWGPQNRSTVDPIFNQRVQDGNVPSNQQLALRSSIYKELFEELSDDEQKKWADMAKEEHDRALERLKAQERRAASHSNADYQRVISALPSIVQPMLDLLCEHTGWKFSLQGGGPEPADGGRLNMIFMHSGVAPGSVSVGFGGAEREAFKKSIMPAFGRYLKRCYNKEACMSRTLPPNHGTATLADVRFEEDVDVALYRVEHDKPAPKKRLFEEEMDRLNKGKGRTQPPTGTPSPMVRFGPPIGKKKNRILPTKDNPASLVPGQSSSKVFKTSPLAQSVITADDSAPPSPSGDTAAEPSSTTASTALRDDMPVAKSTTAADSAIASATTLDSTSRPHAAASDSTSKTRSVTSAVAATASPQATTSTATLSASSNVVEDASADVETTRRNDGTLSSAPAFGSNAPGTPDVRPLDPHSILAHEGSAHEAGRASPPPSPPSIRAPSLPPSPVPSRCSSPAASDNNICPADPPAGPSNEYPATQSVPGSTISPADSSPTPQAAAEMAPPADGATPSTVAATPSALAVPSSPATSVTTPPSADATDVAPPTGMASPTTAGIPSGPAAPPAATLPTSMLNPAAVTKPGSGATTPPGAATVPAFGDSSPDQARRKRSKRAGSNVENTPPSKKQRMSTRAFSIAAATDCPDWASSALDLLASADLGPAWRRLVELWVLLEAKDGFIKKGKMLPAAGRPVVVHDWIKRGREPAYRPNIGNLSSFEATYTSWWRSLQPDWRLHADGVSLVTGSGDWGATKCTGINGLLSALAALFYWGAATSSNAAANALWDAAVQDAVYVFESIL